MNQSWFGPASVPSHRLLKIWVSESVYQLVAAIVATVNTNQSCLFSYTHRPYTLLSDSARQEVLDANNYFPVDHCLGDISQDARFDSVVIGLSPSHFDYPNLNSAFRILKDDAYREASTDGDSYTENFGVDVPISHRRHIPLIATHKARYIETESGLSLGPGPFVTALENAAATTAHVVGKPTKAFFETVIQDFTTHELEAATRFTKADEEISARDRIAVIGDDVEADLGEGAIELGLWRVLGKQCCAT